MLKILAMISAFFLLIGGSSLFAKTLQTSIEQLNPKMICSITQSYSTNVISPRPEGFSFDVAASDAECGDGINDIIGCTREKAQRACEKKGMSLPTEKELIQIHENKESISGLYHEAYYRPLYWSSSFKSDKVIIINVGTGKKSEQENGDSTWARVRCVKNGHHDKANIIRPRPEGFSFDVASSDAECGDGINDIIGCTREKAQRACEKKGMSLPTEEELIQIHEDKESISGLYHEAYYRPLYWSSSFKSDKVIIINVGTGKKSEQENGDSTWARVRCIMK